MRVVLAGASGLIGTALADALRAHGHQVKTLVRRPTDDPASATWDPERGRVDDAFLADADAVVCLSGAGVGDHRWTTAYKEQIHGSRVDTVGTLARALARIDGPQVFLAASAVGYYGDTGDTVATEQSPSGQGFLASVCRD